MDHQSHTQLPTRNLDVLRAVAVLCVAGAHVAELFTVGFGRLSVHDIGRLGVLLFFVHTALVLMSSLERQGQSARWIRAFYVRRAFRLYPLAIVATLAWLAFHIPSAVRSLTHPTPFVPLSARDIVANLALMQNLVGATLPIGVLWSLPLEVQMYVLLPFCYLVARERSGGVVALLIAAIAVWMVGTTLDVPGFWRLTIFAFAPCFLAGVLAYARLFWMKEAPRLPAMAWPLVLAAAFVLAAVVHPGRDNSVAPQWLVCLAVGCAIPLFRDLGENVVTRAAKVVCEYSYGIYLTHVGALWLAFEVCHALPRLAQAAIFVGAAGALAVLSYHAIERPYIAVGKRVGERLVAVGAEPRADDLSEVAAYRRAG